MNEMYFSMGIAVGGDGIGYGPIRTPVIARVTW